MLYCAPQHTTTLARASTRTAANQEQLTSHPAPGCWPQQALATIRACVTQSVGQPFDATNPSTKVQPLPKLMPQPAHANGSLAPRTLHQDS
eukprot:scaffold540_cov10-Tisochrysis_lutea.AAC.1